MEPIVSPWLVYLFSVASSISGIAMVLSAVAGVAVVLVFMFGWLEGDVEAIRLGKMLAVRVLPVALVVAALTPSRETIIAMAVAQHVTADNVSTAREQIVGDVIKIIDAIKEND